MGLMAEGLARVSSSATPGFAETIRESIADVTNTSPESDSNVKVSQHGRDVLRTKVIRTSILYSGVFALGLQGGIIGPSLPDLEQLTGSTTTSIALILTGRNISSLLGTVIAGFLTDKYNNWLLLGVADVVLGMTFAFAPCTDELVYLALCLIPSGVAAGFYDTGVNVAVMNVWMPKPGPWIQAMEFIDAIGSFAAPLLARPFLSRGLTNQRRESSAADLNVSLSGQSDAAYGGNASYPITDSMVVSPDGADPLGISGDHSANYSGNGDSEHGSSVHFAYLIVGATLIAVGVAHLAIFAHENFRLGVEETAASTGRSGDRQPDGKLRSCLVALLFAICFAYDALETGYAQYLMTFVVRELLWSRDMGVAVMSAFWAAYTVGTGAGVLVVKYAGPRRLLLCNATLCLVSQLVLAGFVRADSLVVWCCTAATGLGVSSTFAAVFGWTASRVGVSGRLNALLTVGMTAGELTSPALIGILIDRSGATSWLYCMLSAALLCALGVFLLTHVLAKRLPAATREHTPADDDLMNDAQKENMLHQCAV